MAKYKYNQAQLRDLEEKYIESDDPYGYKDPWFFDTDISNDEPAEVDISDSGEVTRCEEA